MAGTMKAWLNTIQEEYSAQEPFEDRYQTLAEEHYIEMARRSTESRSPPTDATGTVTPSTGITEPSSTEKNAPADGNGVNTYNTSDSSVLSTPPSSQNVTPKTNATADSNGVQTNNVAESPLSTPPTSTEENTPTKNATAGNTATKNSTKADATKPAGPPKSTKTSKKRKTSEDADTHETTKTSKRRKTPQNAENTKDEDATNVMGSSGTATPASGTAEEIAALNATGLDANDTAGPSKSSKTSKKRKTAPDADTHKTSSPPKKLKTAQESGTEKEAVGQAYALSRLRPATPATGTAEEIAGQNGTGLESVNTAGSFLKLTRTSKMRKAAADADDVTVKKVPAKKKNKKTDAEKDLRSVDVITKEYEEGKAAEKRAHKAKETAKQEESANTIQNGADADDTNITSNDSSVSDQSQEQYDAHANSLEAVNSGNEAGEAANNTSKPSAKKAKKRKPDDLTSVQFETSKRARRKTAKAQDALPTKPRKIASKGSKRTSSPPPPRPETPPPPKTVLSAAVQAKLTQVNTFTNAHPSTNFSRIDNNDPQALTLSEITLQGVAQLLYTHYELTPPLEQAQYPLFELESLVLTRGEHGEAGISYPITLEILGLSALEGRIQEKIQGHGVEEINLSKVEIEMALEREERMAESGAPGFRVMEQVERLLAAVEDVDEANESADLVVEKDGGGERVLGACPRPAIVV